MAGNTGSTSTTYTVSSSGGSGGGGGGSSSTSTWTTYPVNEESFSQGTTRDLKANQRLRVPVESEDHYVGIVSLTPSSAVIEVSSDPQRATFNVGETKKFDVTEDGYYDISVTLKEIKISTAEITLLSIHEAVPATPVVEQTQEKEEAPAPFLAPEEESAGGFSWTSIIIVIVVIIIFLVVFYLIKKKR